MINISEALQFILLKRYLKRKKYCFKECERYSFLYENLSKDPVLKKLWTNIKDSIYDKIEGDRL